MNLIDNLQPIYSSMKILHFPRRRQNGAIQGLTTTGFYRLFYSIALRTQ